jgi:uncharacterized protein YlxW (UPF0749 family)
MILKNKMQIGIAIGIMCAILISSIIVQLNTIEEAKKIVGTSYAEQGLKDEVLRWKENYEKAYKELENKEEELEKAREETTKENSRLTELREELDKANKLLGLTELTGEGIVVTLKDDETTSSKELGMSITRALVHEEDIRQIVNELKNTGAEAISINGQRIVPTTAIVCSGAIITVNGVKINAPFEIRAIGDYYLLHGIERRRRIYRDIKR